MTQISLPLEWPGQSGDGEFLVSDANRLAALYLEHWRDWSMSVSILTGPPRSGRSTLGRHFARASGGSVIDDAQGQDDHSLFHAWNSAQTERRPLLLIGEDPPAQWRVLLPDLRSRLAAAHHVAIGEPDEALAVALIERRLLSAGAAYGADVPAWLVRRIERSYHVIDVVTRLLDRAALSSGRKISIAMAKQTLQDAGMLPVLNDPAP